MVLRQQDIFVPNVRYQALNAWEIFIKVGRPEPQNIDIAKAALTYAILHAAAAGQRNLKG